MNIEKTVIDDLNAEISINLQPADYQPRVEKALKDYRKRVQMPGFRAGQVPASLVKQRFGKSILAEEVNNLLQDSIYKYITDNKLEILGSPIPAKEDDEFGDWENPGDFRFKYQLGFAPTIDVTLDKSLKLTYYKVDINDELIDRQIKDLARRYGKMSSPEVSTIDSLLYADFAELDGNGNVKEGGIKSSTNVGIEYIKDQGTKNTLIGLKVGDTVTVDPHKLTENHQSLAEMLGITHNAVHQLESQFQLTVSDVKHIAPHDLNEELFTKLYADGSVTSEEQLREKVTADLETMFNRDSDFLFKREFALSITEKLNPQLPDGFLKKFIAISNEKPLSEEIIESEYPVYAAQLRWELIQGKIISKNELRVTAGEALEHVKGLLKSRYASYGLPLEDNELLTTLANETLAKKEEAKNVYDFLYEEKILALVKENCTIEVKALPFDEFVHKVQH